MTPIYYSFPSADLLKETVTMDSLKRETNSLGIGLDCLTKRSITAYNNMLEHSIQMLANQDLSQFDLSTVLNQARFRSDPAGRLCLTNHDFFDFFKSRAKLIPEIKELDPNPTHSNHGIRTPSSNLDWRSDSQSLAHISDTELDEMIKAERATQASTEAPSK